MRRYGPAAVEDACRRALDAEVVDVGVMERMLARGAASSSSNRISRKSWCGLAMGPVGVGKTFLANALGHIEGKVTFARVGRSRVRMSGGR